MTTPSELKPGIRWGRALVGALLIEIGLSVVAVPFFAAGRMEMLLLVIPPATLVVAAAAGWWAARRAERALATGVLTGLWALVLYVLLAGTAILIAPDQVDMSQSLSASYLASHAFKVIGAAFGGWWVARKRAGAPQAA